MFKIINIQGLGVAGRQNELIELALTYKFNAVEIDMEDLVARHDAMGREFACQFLLSAKMDVGTFQLPIDLGADDATYATACEKLDTIFGLAKELNCSRCYVQIETSSETPFQENFERHRLRLHDLGTKFAAHEMKIGLALQSPSATEKENKFVQTAEEILTLVKTVGQSNVGLFLDTWQWAASGGAMDQIADLSGDQIIETRLADVPADADPANLNKSDRKLPGEEENSLSVKVFEHLKSINYDGPVSVATSLGTFGRSNRNRVVSKISRRIEQLMNGEELKDEYIKLAFEEEYQNQRARREARNNPDAAAKTEDGDKDKDKDKAKADGEAAKTDDASAEKTEEAKTEGEATAAAATK